MTESTPVHGWGTQEARRVAQAACRALGLSSHGLRATRVAKNAIFELPGAGLVVRVTRHGRRDSDTLHVAKAAHAAGVPVLVPVLTDEPLRIDGHDVSFWPRARQARASVDFVWLGRVLRSLHDLTPALVPLAPRRLIADAVASVRTRTHAMLVGADPAPGRVIAERLDAVEAAIAVAPSQPEVVVHGDAHPGNVLLSTEGTLVLADLDHVGVAPRGWDQVPVDVETRRFNRPGDDLAALHAGYGHDCRADAGYEALVMLRELKVTTWLLDLPGAAARNELRARLAYWCDGSAETWTYV